jgi:hypothetical protein
MLVLLGVTAIELNDFAATVKFVFADIPPDVAEIRALPCATD